MIFWPDFQEDNPNEVIVAVEYAGSFSSDRKKAGIERILLPAAPLAVTTLHKGLVNEIHEAYLTLLPYMAENDLQIDGILRVLMLQYAGTPLKDAIIEVQIPAKQGASPP